jgi:predicted DCC family thiol-disulfide oxidoreductase YuxK
MTTLHVNPPRDGIAVILYDGECRLCTAQAKNLSRLGRGKVVSRALQTELIKFPGLAEQDAKREIKLITKDGAVFGGAEAVVQLVNLGQPVLGKLLYPYYIPGIRWLADKTYAWVARNRYRLFGKTEECADEACAVHFNLPQQKNPS